MSFCLTRKAAKKRLIVGDFCDKIQRQTLNIVKSKHTQ